MKSKDAWDENFNHNLSIPWPMLILSFLLLFGYLAMGWVTGLCKLGVGPRGLACGVAVRIILSYLVYTLVVHAVLVWPIANWVYPHYEQRWNKFVRLGAVVLLLSPPLLSFSSFMARGGPFDFNELILIVLPVVLLGALFFESTRRPAVFSLYLATAIFVPLFIINDRLGNYPVWFQYSATDAYFYLWRAVFPVLAVLSVIGFHIFGKTTLIKHQLGPVK